MQHKQNLKAIVKFWTTCWVASLTSYRKIIGICAVYLPDQIFCFVSSYYEWDAEGLPSSQIDNVWVWSCLRWTTPSIIQNHCTCPRPEKDPHDLLISWPTQKIFVQLQHNLLVWWEKQSHQEVVVHWYIEITENLDFCLEKEIKTEIKF